MAEAYDSLINKDRTLQSLHHFFGDPSHPEKIKNYTEDHAATFHFPDAYAGSNQKLRDTLTNLITSHVQSWCTTVALPWLRVQGLEVEWDETKFDVRLLQRVPVRALLPRAAACRPPPARPRGCAATRFYPFPRSTKASPGCKLACAASTASAPCAAASA